jgi:uncharacterized membrane protein
MTFTLTHLIGAWCVGVACGLELKAEYIALAKKRCQVTLGLPF